MSVVSKNPFDLLGDDGDESPSPATTKSKAAAPAAKKADAPAPKRDVPGAGAPAGANAARGGRYPSRGGPRNVYRGNNESPQQDVVAEGTETGQFDGERAPPSRKGNHNHVRDAHTKGPRGSRPAKISGGHTSRGGGAGGRAPNQGGERRQFERRSGALPDSQKKIEQGWGANEGAAELSAEVEGQTDAVAEENAGGDGGWVAPETPAAGADDAAPAAEEAQEDPEEVQRSLDDFLAERAAAALAGLGKKEGRQVNAETLEGAQFTREGIDEFFQGKAKSSTKAPRVKKEKVFIEFDGQFAQPAGGAPRRDRERSGDRPEREGQGFRGGRGGARGGRGGPRGAPRGAGAGGASRGARGGNQAAIDANDTSAFPALGA